MANATPADSSFWLLHIFWHLSICRADGEGNGREGGEIEPG